MRVCEILANNPLMEFHVSREIREKIAFDELLFASSGNIIFAHFKEVREFTKKVNELFNPLFESQKMLKASHVNAMALIDEIFHYICYWFRREKNKNAFNDLYLHLEKILGEKKLNDLLLAFVAEFPPLPVYKGRQSAEEYLSGSTSAKDVLFLGEKKQKTETKIDNKITVLEEFILLHLANENPAFEPFLFLFSNKKLASLASYNKAWEEIKEFFEDQPFIDQIRVL